MSSATRNLETHSPDAKLGIIFNGIVGAILAVPDRAISSVAGDSRKEARL